jgi:uncharacterized protein (DUF433 family)
MESVIQSNGKITGTRISVYDIFYQLENGWLPADIGLFFNLSSEQVQAAVQFIEEHKADVLAVHREIEERNTRGNSPEIEARLEESHFKLQAWLRERRLGNNQERNGAGGTSGR